MNSRVALLGLGCGLVGLFAAIKPAAHDRSPVDPNTRATQLSGPPEVRTSDLINQSDVSGPPGYTPLKPFSDVPSHMTPERVHGGIQ